LFLETWKQILNPIQIAKCRQIARNFETIQLKLTQGHLTFIHGDVKSPNIFYDDQKDIHFIDWQHCAIGKGAQDLIFFIIESFEIQNIQYIFPLFKNYYYKKLLEHGVKNYSYREFEIDVKDALYYIPFFTAIWFGTIPNDELIDPSFPFFFISKLFYLIEGEPRIPQLPPS
jgi:thiamine kinase-like enzyme